MNRHDYAAHVALRDTPRLAPRQPAIDPRQVARPAGLAASVMPALIVGALLAGAVITTTIGA